MASNKNLKIFAMVVFVLLICAIGYIGYGVYAQAKVQKEISVFQQGAQYGYEQGIIQIGQTAGQPSCQPVALNIGENKTVNVIGVECLGTAA